MGGRLDCAATVAALLLTIAQAAPSQSVKPASPSAGDARARSKPRDEGHEGYSTTVKVHGDWTIVVRNPDGSIASTHRFENSIASGGQSFFASLMARQAGTFFWVVRLENLCGTAPSLRACGIAESPLANDSILSNWFGGAVTPSLAISNPHTGPNAYKFVLSGSLASSNTGQITRVGTETVIQNGATDGIGEVTGTNLQTPISVEAGQTIDVTVVIGFS
jgi:hypothetical protein